MANENHVAILKRSIKEWNDWRERSPFDRPDLTGANLSEVSLYQADLRWSDLKKVNAHRADFCDADLSGAALGWANLRRADFSGADLNAAQLYQADLTGANLKFARLAGANLVKTMLSAADLGGADLTGADLSDADLNGANLSGSNLNGANFLRVILGATTFGLSDLRSVKELHTVLHVRPSTIGIDTIYRSKGQVPEPFLRGAGVPEPFIANIKALVAAMEPIQLYSCFISYSTKNQQFAERLHADLQSRGVRCWFAPEDMKIGDKFRTRIDEAIRLYDKVLLVLTEDSVKSAWVEMEVETAFERERKQRRTVLFPIRLDDAVMEADEAWAADIRRTRHIGDFCGWKEHDTYRKAFERLMNSLKAEDQGEKQKIEN